MINENLDEVNVCLHLEKAMNYYDPEKQSMIDQNVKDWEAIIKKLEDARAIRMATELEYLKDKIILENSNGSF